MRSEKPEAVKIVQIETRYVQTDAMNFRDVVQGLTGKNSSTAWVGNGSIFPHDVTASSTTLKSEELGTTPHDHGARDHSKEDGSLSSMIIKNMSFKDFDRLLYELPPMEDLPRLGGRSDFAT